MDLKTIELLAAILFILIAVVGGGFIIKELQFPSVPTWARIVSGFLGLIFLFLCFFEVPYPGSQRLIYSYKDSDISQHGLKLINLSAKCIHNPPKVNDSIEVEFALQNINKKSVSVLETFVVGRDPDGKTRDFGHQNQNKVIQPNDMIENKGIIVVDAPGWWKFGPSYEIGKDIYPGEWQRFIVHVAP